MKLIHAGSIVSKVTVILISQYFQVEVLDKNENSLVVSQIAFPEDVNSTVYATPKYLGKADTSNDRDNIFRDSLALNMADALSGDAQNGYLLLKTLTV